MDTPSRARDAMLRQEAIRARDRLLIELARKHCGDLKGVKPKADRIAAWARTYEGTAWARDKHASSCPERLRGRPEGLIWNTLNHDFTLRPLFLSKTTKSFNHSAHKLRILSVLLFGDLGLIADHPHNLRVFDLGNKDL